jgi:hypothetical protein
MNEHLWIHKGSTGRRPPLQFSLCENDNRPLPSSSCRQLLNVLQLIKIRTYTKTSWRVWCWFWKLMMLNILRIWWGIREWIEIPLRRHQIARKKKYYPGKTRLNCLCMTRRKGAHSLLCSLVKRGSRLYKKARIMSWSVPHFIGEWACKHHAYN